MQGWDKPLRAVSSVTRRVMSAAGPVDGTWTCFDPSSCLGASKAQMQTAPQSMEGRREGDREEREIVLVKMSLQMKVVKDTRENKAEKH